jgi:hypothetical protein
MINDNSTSDFNISSAETQKIIYFNDKLWFEFRVPFKSGRKEKKWIHFNRKLKLQFGFPFISGRKGKNNFILVINYNQTSDFNIRLAKQPKNEFIFIPFSERKGYTALKSWAWNAKSLSDQANQKSAWCKPIKNQPFLREKDWPKVIGGVESESEVSFFIFFFENWFFYTKDRFFS